MRVKPCEYFFKVMSKNLLFFALSAKDCGCQKKSAIVKVISAENIERVWSFFIGDKINWMCEYSLREETSKIVRVFLLRENYRKSEYFCEHPKFGEDFGREHFKFSVIKRRVNQSFSISKKARKKKTYGKIPPLLASSFRLTIKKIII